MYPSIFEKILNFYEISLESEIKTKIILQTRGKGDMVSNINKGTLQSWAYSSNFRSGKIGGWRSDFNQKNIDYFKEKDKGILISLNYEEDNNWQYFLYNIKNKVKTINTYSVFGLLYCGHIEILRQANN